MTENENSSSVTSKLESEADENDPKNAPSDLKNDNKLAKIDNVVNENLLHNLETIGMDVNLSKKALKCTGNKSVEAALQWIAELGAEEMEALCNKSDLTSDSSSDWEDCEDEVYYKMVFVVNMEHGMGAGKIASQPTVAHSALNLYKILKDDREKYQNSLEEWEETGEKKITLKGENTQALIKLQADAEGKELPTYLVEDAGRTQIPSGSVTVLGIFGDEEAVNEVTGHLKLL